MRARDCYARKDRKSKPRDPVTTRYIASLFEAVGVDCAVTLDVHNLAAYQNAWQIPTDHLEARTLFVNHSSQRRPVGDACVCKALVRFAKE
jgi:ribose-phosphate pyrophosphokinase